MDRELATKHLIAAFLPLMTIPIQDDLTQIRSERGGPGANLLDVFDLWQKHPWHFANYIWERRPPDAERKVLHITDDGLDFTEDAQNLIRDYILEYYRHKVELEAASSEEFLRLYRVHKSKIEEDDFQKACVFDSYQFFSFPETEANMGHWTRLSGWMPAEVISLAFGKDPDVVNSDKIRSSIGNNRSIFAKRFFEFERLIMRAFDTGQLKSPVAPRAFTMWAANAGVQLPNDAIQRFLGPSVGIEEDTGSASEREVSTQAVHKLYKILLGISIAKYGFSADPAVFDYADLLKLVFDDLNRVGLGLDPKTLTKYYDRAYAFARQRNLFKAPRGKISK